MVPQGPPAPVGGAHSVPHSLLRSNSGLLGGQGGGMSSQNSFSMLVSPHSQFSGMNMLGNGSNVSSLFHQSHGSSQRGLIDGGAESNPLGGVGNGVVFNTPSSSYVSSPVTATPNSSGQVSGQQQFLNPSGNLLLMEQQQAQHLDQQNFQHNQQHMQLFSVPNGSQQQQQQYQSPRHASGGAVPMKQEQQTSNENLQQLQALRNLPPVKLEPQQLQNMRNLGPVKIESQQTDPSLFLQQQQQQILLSRQSPQAAAAAQMFHQQRLLQLQQQQFLKAMPHQRSPLQQQFQSQNMPLRSPAKSVYEPGMCARRLTHYMYQQQRRPEDNNIEFWRNFVAEFFAPNAKKKWCISMYGSGRQTNGVFPQDVWHCEICNRKPGCGFEATVEVLPRLFKIKYESGTIEELLYVDMPQEYETASGQIVLEYTKAIQESVFEKLRVVRDGQLRIVFSPDLKICSWEFCALRHDELIPRRLLIPQVNQLGAAAQKYQAAVQNASVTTSASDQQNYCNMFVASAHQLAKALEVPLVNDLGYTKRYIRCLQISEVVNSMKDLIEFSRETGAGPVESLSKFPRRMNPASAFQGHPQLPEGQQQHQTGVENRSNDNRAPAATMQMPSTVQGVKNVSPGCTSSGNIPGLINQNSMNFRQQNPNPATNGTYGGNGVQMSSPVSSTNVPQTQPSSSPFQSPPTPSSSNNAQATANIILPGGANSHSPNISMQQSAHSGDADANDTQSSVQKIIHGMMMSSQHNGSGMMGNGIFPSRMNPIMNNGNVLAGTLANGNTGNESMGNGLDHSVIVNGIRAALGNSSMSMSGRMGMAMARERGMNPQQQDMSNQLQMLSSLGGINSFNNLHFDWKTMP